MLLTENVEISLSQRNISHFKNLGYDCNNKKIIVKIKDLMPTSKTRIKVMCDNCGIHYELSYGNYVLHNRDGKTYCKKCIPKLFNSGINNLAYNPNISDEERIINRNYSDYYNFVKGVLKRDNYNCVICKSNKNLKVHHLDGYNWCIEKRTKIENGITLCQKCHKKFHYIYGNKNNTKQQFEDWVNKIFNTEYNINFDELPTCRKIIRVEDKYIIDNPIAYCRVNKIPIINLYQTCNKKRGSFKGLHYMWYNEYLQLNQKELIDKLYEGHYKKVVCIENKLVFLSIKDAIRYYQNKNKKLDPSRISAVCKHKRKTHGNFHWCYLKDYKEDIEGLQKVGDDW